MAKKRIRKSKTNLEKEQYLKIDPNAAGLTLGTVSFVLGIILIIGLNFLDAQENIPINAPSNLILFMLSSFIEGTILGYIVAWIYNKFIYIAK